MELSNSQTAKENIIGQNLSDSLTSDKQPISQKRRSTKSSKISKRSQETEEEVELSDEEVKLSIVNDIREEIVKTVLDLIYEKYLEKQTVYFVSHCSRLAWRALVDWNFQKKDRGGYVEAHKERRDQEPLPSEKDSWAGHSVPKKPDQPTSCKSKQRESKTTVSPPISTIISPSASGLRTVSGVDPHTSLKRGRMLKQRTEKISNNMKKSEDIGTRIETKSTTKADDMKKESYELPCPVPLQSKHFPSARVEVQYAIMPGNPSKGTNLALKNELKTKTIVLKKDNEENKFKSKEN